MENARSMLCTALPSSGAPSPDDHFLVSNCILRSSLVFNPRSSAECTEPCGRMCGGIGHPGHPRRGPAGNSPPTSLRRRRIPPSSPLQGGSPHRPTYGRPRRRRHGWCKAWRPFPLPFSSLRWCGRAAGGGSQGDSGDARGGVGAAAGSVGLPWALYSDEATAALTSLPVIVGVSPPFVSPGAVC